MAESLSLFCDERKPIIDCLTNINVETWRQEGLFKRSRVVTKFDGIIELSIGKKMRFVQGLISKWHELPFRDLNSVRTDSETGLSRQMVIAERRMSVKKIFGRVKNHEFAAYMAKFILIEKPVQAQYFAKKIGARWPQFVIDFNDGLADMMVGL